MAGDAVFAGSIPALYDRHLGPTLFAPFAADLARRVAEAAPARLLEAAAGTGIVTRALAAALPAAVEIVATDLNPPMLAHAAAQTRAGNVRFQQADAQALPFADEGFDAVVCQFGVMFFPDKPRAFAEARRVLRAGGRYLFSTWDSLATNPATKLVQDTVAARWPADPPQFLGRTPHGYFDAAAIARALAAAGFVDVAYETVALRAPASAQDFAVGLCQGCPLSAEIEARQPGGVLEVTAAVEAALAARFGARFDADMQAIVFSAQR